MPQFRVVASERDAEGKPFRREGPFFWDAPDAAAARDLYRRWAWSQNRGPAPLQPSGPLPIVTARRVEG